MAETAAERFARRCKHFRGMYNKDECLVGVRFDTLPAYGTQAFMDVCPCFVKGADGCDKAEYPTPKQVTEYTEYASKRATDSLKAYQAISAAIGSEWKRGSPSVSGTIDCPACSGVGTLGYSRSGYNGHIHAQCSTPGCVSWIQ